MRISLMLLLTAAVLVVSGIGERTLKDNGLNKANVLFFLLCTAVLSGFTIEPSEEAEVTAASLFCAVWLFGNSFNTTVKCGHSFLVLPISLAAAAISSLLSIFSIEAAFLIALPISASVSLLLGMSSGLAFGGLYPILSSITIYVFTSLKGGYAIIEASENCLIQQILCIYSAVLTSIISSTIKTKHSIRTY